MLDTLCNVWYNDDVTTTRNVSGGDYLSQSRRWYRVPETHNAVH